MKTFFRVTTWAGPVTIGSFIVVAATGIMMFFHLASGLMKFAHEWLGWLLVVAVVAHVAVNWRPFVRYFSKPGAVVIMAALVVLGGLAFVTGSGSRGGRHPLMGAFMALEQSSLDVVAQVAKSSSDVVLAQLRAKGIQVRDGGQTIQEIASQNGASSMEILGGILGNPGPRSGEGH